MLCKERAEVLLNAGLGLKFSLEAKNFIDVSHASACVLADNSREKGQNRLKLFPSTYLEIDHSLIFRTFDAV
jgi:hypothetical protein